MISSNDKIESVYQRLSDFVNSKTRNGIRVTEVSLSSKTYEKLGKELYNLRIDEEKDGFVIVSISYPSTEIVITEDKKQIEDFRDIGWTW